VSLERHNLPWLVLPAFLHDFVATMVSCPPWLFYALFLTLYLGQVRISDGRGTCILHE
jgi:hypothetical protein